MSKIQQIDAITSESITRDMTNSELEGFENEIAISETLKAQEKAKLDAKKVLLDKLGISEEEAALLLT